MQALDVRVFHTGADAAQFLDQLGPQGRAEYTLHQTVDVAYMASFTGLFWVLMRRLEARPWMQWFALMPGAADFAEDSVHLLLMRQYPAMSPALLSLSGVVTCAKWVCVALFFLVMLRASWLARTVPLRAR